MMKKYESYKPSGVEFIGDIPEHWEVRKLKYIMDIIRTGTTPDTKNEEYFNGDINWFKPENLNQPILNFATERVTQFALESKKVKMLQKDSVLVVGIGATSGKTAYLNIEATFNQQITGFHSFENCNKYYYYIFENFKSTFLQLASYTTLAILNNEFFKSFIIPLPPLNEQEKVANFLDIKNQQIEEFIKEKQHQIALLEEQKEAIINQAVTKGLDDSVKMKDSGIEWIGDIPKPWKPIKLKYISDINTTTLTNKTNDDYEIKYIDISNVDTKGLIAKPLALLFEEAPSRAKRIVQKNDIILSTVRTYLKAIAYLEDVEDNWIASTGFAVLTSKDKIFSKYLYYMLISKYFIAQVGYCSVGVTYPSINVSDLGDIKVCLPSKNEQIEIIEYIETELCKIDKVINQIQKEIDLIKEYKISLISEVVTGQIDVR